MKTSCLFLLVCLIITISVTGCWDMRDIDERSLVLGLTIDKSEEENDEYVLGIELPVLAETDQGNGGGGSNGEKSVSHLTTGKTISEMLSFFEKRVWRELFLGHMKVIVLSDEVAREGFEKHLDFFDRNPHIDRRVKLVISEGKASDLFEIDNPREPIGSMYLNRMLEMKTQSSRMLTQNLQDDLIRLELFGATTLPRVRFSNDELVTGGSAIIKDFKLICWLGEPETRVVQFLYDDIDGGLIAVKLKDTSYTYMIQTAKTKIKPKIIDNELTFVIKIESEGNIIETQPKRAPLDAEIVQEIQSELNLTIKRDIQGLLHKFQNELKVDPIGFAELTRRHYPLIWRENQEIWHEEFFPTINIIVETDFSIRRTGILQ